MAEEQLPLFPLSLVLFPGSSVQLRIFEERYRRMIGACIGDGTEFGVVLLNNTVLHPVGCSARVMALSGDVGDPTFDIVVEGTRKFRLEGIRQTDDGYLLGAVDPLREDDDRAPFPVLLRAARLYRRVMEAATDILHPPASFALDHATPASYQIAEKAGLPLEARQRLLEESSEAGRLRLLIEHLDALLPELREQRAMRALAENDGYLPRRRS
jgi:ATP-dependent Lon protease